MRARAVGALPTPAGLPELVRVDFDLWTLRAQLWFPPEPAPVYVRFTGVRGFRALDEGDLLEFWDPRQRAPGWLWQIDAGGWFAQESLRPGFVAGLHGDCREFLLLGQDWCLSVLCLDRPEAGPQVETASA